MKINPCPYCGAKGKVFSIDDILSSDDLGILSPKPYFCGCADYEKCDTAPTTSTFETKEEAISDWNKVTKGDN